MKQLRRCDFCGRWTENYLTDYFHRLRRRLTICTVCLKRRLQPGYWNGLKDEIESLYLEKRRFESDVYKIQN